MKLTPNVKWLLFRKVSIDAIPDGGGLEAGIDAIRSGKIVTLLRENMKWVEAMINEVKNSRDNPYGNDDEAIATAIRAEYERREQTKAKKR